MTIQNQTEQPTLAVESVHQVRIHIDQQPYKSPEPTTGEALYALGKVHEGFDLFREVDGDEEDQLVANNNEKVHLKEDDHFHSAEHHKKEFTIFVNTRPKVVTKRKLSFVDVIILAYGCPPAGGDTIYTVAYRKAKDGKQGTLVPGQTVKIKDGTIFDVTRTNKS